MSQPQIVYEGKQQKACVSGCISSFFLSRTAWCFVSYLQLCNLTKVHRITRVVRHRVTCTVLHHVCFFFFFFPPLAFVFVILVYFWTLKTVALSLFVTVLLLYTVFFAFACFYFIQKLVPQCHYYGVVWPVFLSIIYHVVHIHTLSAFLSLCSLPPLLHCRMYALVCLFFFLTWVFRVTIAHTLELSSADTLSSHPE